MKKIKQFFLIPNLYLGLAIIMLCSSFEQVFADTYYVTPNGNSSNSGNSFSNAINFSTALSRVEAGDTIMLQAGKYSIAYSEGNKNTIKFSKSGTSSKKISIITANNGIATFDFSFPEKKWVQSSYGFYVTGSHWYFKGIHITRAGYQGSYVTGSNNTFENCAFYENRNTGLEINKGGSYTTVINCDAYKNYDPKKNGSMADGFGPKQSQGPGNKFIGCRAWENSDDGYDAYDSDEVVTFEKCWAFRNGIDIWNYGSFSGNGNGFKVGGNKEAADNVITNCVAFENVNKGFDQNNNTGSLTFYNCTGYNNGVNFGVGNPVNSGEKHTFRNNISYKGKKSNSISNASSSYNSWELNVSISDSDFNSLSTSAAKGGRKSNGDLPDNLPFQLVSGSDLIDKGQNVGLPYSGNSPDLGAFEFNGTNDNDDEEEDEEPEINLTATAGSDNIKLDWTLVKGILTRIEVYRDTDSNPSGRTRLASLNVSERSYTDNNVTAGVTYYYWIKSNNANSSNAASATVAVNSNDPEINLTVNGKNLNWTISNIDVSRVDVYRDTDSNPSGRTRIANVSRSTRSYTDNSASSGTTYYYWIKVRDTNGTNYNSNTGTNGSGKFSSGKLESPIVGFSMYPNPSKNGNVTIKGNETISSVIIADLTGKIIKEVKANSDTVQLELSNARGLYFIKINGENSITTKRLIIK